MGDQTLVSWADKTFNPWHGCARVSPACRFCYMFRDMHRYGLDEFTGRTGKRRIASEAQWTKPGTTWKRDAERAGRRLRVFCASWADVFEDRPELVEARRRLWRVVESTPWLDWMILTKRPENITGMIPDNWVSGWPDNTWLGVSAESQRWANARIPLLVQQRAAVRFVSAEPTLGEIDLFRIPAGSAQQPEMVFDVLGKKYGVPGRWSAPMDRGVDWVITGGESGHQAGVRPSHPDWYRALRDQCTTTGVAYHHKQNGAWVAPDQVGPGSIGVPLKRTLRMWPDGTIVRDLIRDDLTEGATTLVRLGEHRSGRLLDGQVWDQFPAGAVAA